MPDVAEPAADAGAPPPQPSPAPFSAMAELGLKAVDPVVRIVRALDRLHAAARPLAAAVAADTAEPEAQGAPTQEATADLVLRSGAAGSSRRPLPRAPQDDDVEFSTPSPGVANGTKPTRKPLKRLKTGAEIPIAGRRRRGDRRRAAALGERGCKRADAGEFLPAPNLAAIRRGGAAVRALAAAGA